MARQQPRQQRGGRRRAQRQRDRAAAPTGRSRDIAGAGDRTRVRSGCGARAVLAALEDAYDDFPQTHARRGCAALAALRRDRHAPRASVWASAISKAWCWAWTPTARSRITTMTGASCAWYQGKSHERVSSRDSRVGPRASPSSCQSRRPPPAHRAGDRQLGEIRARRSRRFCSWERCARHDGELIRMLRAAIGRALRAPWGTRPNTDT